TTIDNITWKYTFVNLSVNDYDIIFIINDTTNNTLVFEDYFEVYIPRILYGNVTNALNNGVNTSFKFYRNGTNKLLHSFNSINGYYNETIHLRKYDLVINAYDMISKIYELDSYNLSNDFIKIDQISPAETNLIKSVNGIAFNSTITNKAKIRIYYSQDVLVNYGLIEDYLKIFACYSWIWNQRSCTSSDLWYELSDFYINKLYNYIEFNTSSFSSLNGYVAYVIAERKPPSYAELNVYDVDAINIHHGSRATINITIKSTGNADVLNAKIDCISGAVCQDFNATYLRAIGNIAPNEVKIVRINISVPIGYENGSYYGIVRFSGDNINPVDKTLQVNVLENRSWKVDKVYIVKEIGKSYGKLDEIKIESIANTLLNFEIEYSDLLHGITNLTLNKLEKRLLEIYYNTTIADPSNYSQNITIKSIGSNPEILIVNVSLRVVNLTLEIIEPANATWLEVNETLNIKLRLFINGRLINSTNNASFEIYLNNKRVNIEKIIFNETSKTFDVKLKIPITTVENTLTIKAYYYPFNYTTELVKKELIFVHDRIPPIVNETQAIVLENKTIIRVFAYDNDKINITSINITYPNGSTIYLDLLFNKTTKYYEYEIDSKEEGDYKIKLLVKDNSNNSIEKEEWFRVGKLIYVSGNLKIPTKLEFIKPIVGYKFKEFFVNGSYNESLRAGNYDIKFVFENVEVKIKETLINNSVENPIVVEKVHPALIPISLVKGRFDSVIYKSNLNFSNISLTFSFSSYVDKISNIRDLRIYKCVNFSFEESRCLTNFTKILPVIDHFRLKLTVILNQTDPLIILVEEVVCGNNICDSNYGENNENCPLDCRAQPICGNNVCELGETPYTCPEDCGSPPTITPSPSPPPTPPPTVRIPTTEIIERILEELEKMPKEKIYVSERTLNLNLYQGESLKIRIKIKNQMEKNAVFEITSVGEVAEFISFVNSKISLKPMEEGEFGIIFLVPMNAIPKLYTGSLLIISGEEKAEIPINLRVLSVKEELLDVRLTTLKDEIMPGYALPLEVTLYNLGKTQRVDVDLLLEIFDVEKGEIVTSMKEVLAVETSLSRVFYLKVPKNLEERKYMVRATASFSYLNRTVAAQSFAYFMVKTPFLLKSIFGLKVWQLLIIFSISLASIITTALIYRKRKIEAEKRRRYKVLLETKYLPRESEDSAFVGNLAETGTRTWIYLKDLTTHCMVAGATGSGKTIAAMVLAEEALLKGKSVIVFDPTAQWTGFLRKCKEDSMLKNYKFFGLDVKDARAFKGKIKMVESALEKVNLKEIILSKEPQIVVFCLTKLDSKDIDIFVANTINEIFKARLPESRELKCLIVYDEVHRLLPKFGGSGKGFLALERGVREFRKWGIGLVLISQVLSDFVGEIKANIGMEIQMRSRYEDDLDRISRKYGKEIELSVVKASVGTGMIVFSEYNRGRPYFVSFRPILHQVSRLSDEELEKYVSYDKRLEEVKFLINFLKKSGVDVFDLEIELGLCETKLMEGAFDVVDIYLESLEPRVKGEFKKRRIEIPEYKPELIEEKEIEKIVKKAEMEREKFLKKFKEKITIEYLNEMVKEVKELIKEAKNKGIDTFTYEIDLERIPTEIKIVEISKEVKGMQDIAFKLNNIKSELEKLIKEKK
ncbi:MAG: DUF87 domain-containing protein, partial [Candidatus Aenigmarchaeota archaeon]|nr:DUF87 domain-containing protein [Candidatus Aenigmarchaeota archaeon]MDW8149565.1 DUF87 domain-containing protein [Candidatus Aenigmarchaeota archaeon]